MIATHTHQNETFFNQVVSSPRAYGIFTWKTRTMIFKRVEDKITMNDDDLDYVRTLVSSEYFNKYFIKDPE